MYMISNDVLKESLKLNKLDHIIDHKWQYPLTKKVQPEYSYETAQSLLELSYLVSIHNRENIPIELDPPKFDVVIPLNIMNLCNVAWCFYSSELNILVLVFTATYNDELVVVDLDFREKDVTQIGNYIPGIRAHGGFWTLYQSIQQNLLDLLNKYYNNDTQLIITGLSLGGAMSTICALDLWNRKLDSEIKNMVHYSFASPRVFNVIGSWYYDYLNMNSYRIQNDSDVITDLPFSLMIVSEDPLVVEDFEHVNTKICYNLNLGSYYNNHILSYLVIYNIVPM
jgi:predicted lipase